MNETQKRIAAYQAALPGLKERVFAVLLLLVMSAAMLTSASFAWITLSQAPEVTSVSTTLAANGNLEIALVNPDGVEPGASQVGDSSAAEGQSVVDANITWGNLVNLSDSSYGLEKIVLRPALLGDTNNLLSKPLKGVNYTADGRVEREYNQDYQFANYEIDKEGNGAFKYNAVPKYGVRAISTIEYSYVNEIAYDYKQLMTASSEVHRQAVLDGYAEITGTKQYIDALAGLLGQFMTDTLADSDSDVSGYVTDLYNMMSRIYRLLVGPEGQPDATCFENALLHMANAQVLVFCEEKGLNYEDHSYTRGTLMSATAAQLQANGVDMDSISEYKTVKKGIEEVLFGKYDSSGTKTREGLYDFYVRIHKNEENGEISETYDNGKSVLRSELMDSLVPMVDIGSTEVTKDNDTKTVNQILALGKTDLAGYYNSTVTVVVTKGYLKDFEQLVGGRLNAKNVKISAQYMISITITAKTISTNASQPYTYDADYAATELKAESVKGTYTGLSQDTYGMALDFWLRTNHASTYLTLEGNVIATEEQVRATGLNRDGQKVELYTITVSEDAVVEGIEVSVSTPYAVYWYHDEELDADVLYYAENHVPVYGEDGSAPDGKTISEPIERFDTVKIIHGYEGENRVWDTDDEQNQFLTVDSTTQGNGSCYVFYAEDPAQQENSLRLLSSLRVAFVDCNPTSVTYGKMVGLAKLDTENAYEASGKVTVPLALMDDGSTYLTKNGEELAIMAMEQNVAMRLTALVYLDGREITNAEVLAASEIQGQLNIQFGSSESMEPIRDKELESATRSISAVAKKYSDADYPAGNDSAITFSYDEADEEHPMAVDVRVTVNGDKPTRVEAFFMRKVNDAQGSREESFRLDETGSGVYEGRFEFEGPGEYVLRTVQLDGIDYDLPSGSYPKVSISGFGIDSVTVRHNGLMVDEHKYIMTGASKVSADLSLSFKSDQKLPSSVSLQFRKDDGTQVTARMSYNTTDAKWYGTAEFIRSGEYTLMYAILDGDYKELDPDYRTVLDLDLGITVVVDEIPDPNGVDYRETTWQGVTMSPQMYVKIYDDSDNLLQGLPNVRLVYSGGSGSVADEDPGMTWDDAEKRYEGNIRIDGPGTYKFLRVEVKENTTEGTVHQLTNVDNKTPEFRCVNPNPPEYVSALFPEGDYFLSAKDNNGNLVNDVYFEIYVKNAETAEITAVFDNGKTATGVKVAGADVTGEDGQTTSKFKFSLPVDASTGFQSGVWTLTQLQLTGVFSGSGDNVVYHDAANPLVWNVSDLPNTATETHTLEVVNMKLTLGGADYNQNAQQKITYTGGKFLETKNTENALTFTITDQNGDPLKVALGDLTIQYALDHTKTQGAGGYTATHLEDQSGAGELDTYTLKLSDGKTYTLPSVKLTYAGEYYPYSMTYTVADTAYEYSSYQLSEMKLPIYRWETTAPVVEAAAVMPTGTINTTITINGADNYTYGDPKTNGASAITDTAGTQVGWQVNVYASGRKTPDATGDASFEVPKLQFKASGVGTSDTVTFTIPGTAVQYANNQGNNVTTTLAAKTFTITGNGNSNKESMGARSQKVYEESGGCVSTCTVYGFCGYGENIIISQVTVNSGGNPYTVYLKYPLTIVNPTSIPVQ